MESASAIIQKEYQKVYNACLQAVKNTSDDLQSTGRDTVREWNNRPDFGEELLYDENRIEATIKPKGNKRIIQIFQYVDKGTKPHIIMPKVKGAYLKFQTGYSRRTMPINKYNVGVGRSFGDWVSKAMVFHPGSKARHFLETDLKELVPSFQQRVQLEITKVIS